MAKATPVAPSPAPTPAPAAIAVRPSIVDTRTGEVVEAGPGAETGLSTADIFDANVVEMMDNNLLAKLEKVDKAQVKDFKELEKDFWKPGEPGTPDAIIQGIYLGSMKVGRLLQHAIAIKGKNNGGKPVVVRLNGAHGLSQALKQLEPKDGVRIEFKGTGNTLSGNRMHKWEVKKLS